MQPFFEFFLFFIVISSFWGLTLLKLVELYNGVLSFMVKMVKKWGSAKEKPSAYFYNFCNEAKLGLVILKYFVEFF